MLFYLFEAAVSFGMLSPSFLWHLLWCWYFSFWIMKMLEPAADTFFWLHLILLEPSLMLVATAEICLFWHLLWFNWHQLRWCWHRLWCSWHLSSFCGWSYPLIQCRDVTTRRYVDGWGEGTHQLYHFSPKLFLFHSVYFQFLLMIFN